MRRRVYPVILGMLISTSCASVRNGGVSAQVEIAQLERNIFEERTTRNKTLERTLGVSQLYTSKHLSLGSGNYVIVTAFDDLSTHQKPDLFRFMIYDKDGKIAKIIEDKYPAGLRVEGGDEIFEKGPGGLDISRNMLTLRNETINDYGLLRSFRAAN